MNGSSPERGATAADLAFLEAHVRDTQLLTGLVFDQLPRCVAALADACLAVRHVEDGRIRALGLALDRGLEREILAIAVQPAARGKGLAKRMLERLVRVHAEASPRHRALASVWPGLRDAAGLLLAAGFETSAGAVRFERGVEPLRLESAAPNLRWLDVAREPDERRRRLVAAAVAAYPGDADPHPTLSSLSAAPKGFLEVGFAGADARVVAAGYEDDAAIRLTTLFASETLKDHVAAEHLMARLVDRARAGGRRKVVVESARPVARTVQAVFRLGFRAVEAAAGFRLGPIPQRTPPHVFAV